MKMRIFSPTHLTTMLFISAGGLACSQTISGQEAEVQGPDASIEEVSPPDAAVEEIEPDAAPPPQAAPCVEGDARVSGPDETCYMFFATPLDWPSSQAACVALGATLITVLDADEQVFAGQLALNADAASPDVWMGASDEQLENSFVWVDGTTMIFDVWRAGEPNNAGPNGPENCAIIEGDNPALEWDDRDCTTLFPYLCERAPPG